MKKTHWVLFLTVLVVFVALVAWIVGNPAYFAKVNGVELLIAELDERVAKAEKAIPLIYPQQQFDHGSIEYNVARNMIEYELMKADNEAKGWGHEEPTVVANYEAQKASLSEEESRLYVECLGLTETELLTCLSHRYYVTESVTVTDDDLKQYFLYCLENGMYTEAVTVRHILVATEEEAVDVRNKLIAGGDFAALVKEKSLDQGSIETGGVYADVSRGVFVQEFEEAAFALKEGELSEPVKTEFGYHVIEKMKYRPAATEADFVSYRGEIQTEAIEYYKDAKHEEYVLQLMDTNSVEYSWGYRKSLQA